jgi:hypothetical protein
MASDHKLVYKPAVVVANHYRTSLVKKGLQEKALAITKKNKTEKTNLSPRNMKACQCPIEKCREGKTQSTMQSSKKTLHEFSPYTPQKRRKGT